MSQSPMIKFKKGAENLLSTTPIVEGQVLFTTDKNNLFIDISNTERIQVNDDGKNTRTTKVVVGCTNGGWTEKDCDYLCTDDTEDYEIINTAIGNGNREVILLSGTYHLTYEITLQSNTTLTGNGASTRLEQDSYGNMNLISMQQNAENILIQNMYIYGNSDYDNDLQLDIGYSVSIRNCDIKFCNILIKDDSSVIGNTIEEGSITISGDRNIVTDNILPESSIKLTLARFNTVANNIISTGNIYLYDSSNQNIINNNKIIESTEPGIHLKDNCSFNLIVGNQVLDFVKYPVSATNYCENNTFSSNLYWSTTSTQAQQPDYGDFSEDDVASNTKVIGDIYNGDIITYISASDVGALGRTETAAAATKLATPRSIRTNLASESAINFDGSQNITPGVTGILPISHGGIGASTAAQGLANLGGVPTSRTINSKALTSNITLTAANVNALPSNSIATAYNDASLSYSCVRNIKAGTTAPSTSTIANGEIYLQYT